MILQDKNFGFLMTRGISLVKWDKIGILEREIRPYQKLAEYFNKVYLFTYGNFDDKSYSNLFPINVEIVTKRAVFPALIYSFLLPFINRKKMKDIQIIKTNQMDGSWSAVISKKFYGTKLIVRCGYEWLQTIKKAKKSNIKKLIAYYIEKFAYSNADNIILTSEDSRKFVIRKFNICPEKIQIIPNYVDVNYFKPSSVDKEKNRIIFVGRLEKEKNLFNLLSSLEGLDVRLVLIGSGSLRRDLEKIAKEKRIDAVFKGNTPQSAIPEELNKSQIFILPSFYEGNPKVLLEAMSCGLACIGSDVEGINSIITDGEDGILSLTDPNSLRTSIVRLIENKELCAKLGINARKKIEAQNSFSVLVEKELSVYESI